tara:strand:+ start:544 stop:780 length:237 start_codon:yes stop_codon:yes gene_type:complete
MTNNINVGQLVFLPSDLTLLQFSKDIKAEAPRRWIRVDKPTHVLVVNDDPETPYYSILYNGEKWSVPRHLIYPMKETK